MDWKIPLFKIYWNEEDVKMATKSIQRGMFWAIGPNIERFENMLAEYTGRKYAVAFNSGTSALHAALLAYGIGEGDEVIVPSFTFIATANAPLFVGARPVFADIEEKTLGLDPEDVRRKITPRTKAIIPVHYGGGVYRVEELSEIAREHNLLLIEDAAESLGATVGGKKIGGFGDCAILSFCANKVITTGEGGAAVTDSAEIAEKLRLIRSHGRSENTGYFSTTESPDYITLGYNFRMPDIVAALGIAQLARIEEVIQIRRQKAASLTGKLISVPGIEVPGVPADLRHVYQMFTVKISQGREKRDALIQYLAGEGIMSKVYFEPAHLSHFYKNTLGYDPQLPVTERLAEQVLSLPMYPALSDDEISYIAEKMVMFFA